jgi:CBS domain-containing protein
MPTGTIHQPIEHTFAAPPFEEASVVDGMRVGVVSCPPDTPVREVARIMATYRIHCVVVSEMKGTKPSGVVSDIDLAAAASAGVEGRTAGQLAGSEAVTVAADDSLERAAQLMAEHQVSHLVVIQPHSGHPVGVLSALDLAGVLAWGGTA